MNELKSYEENQDEQEIITPQVVEALDSKTLAILQKSEIDQQIATAKRFPRNPTKLLTTAVQLVTSDSEMADECIYTLPRAGKVVEGPSVRFAEIMAHSWGNCRIGGRVISEDEEFVTAMGTFFDMEQNLHVGYEVKRRITDSKGRRYSSDMIATTANAACAIALRNATLRGIPKAFWKKVYAQARQVVAGDIKTLEARRQMMVKTFELMGVKREQIFAKLEVKGIDDIGLDHLLLLRGIYNTIREQEMTPQQAFAPEPTQDANLAAKSNANLEKIKEKYAQPKEAADKSGASQPPSKDQTSREPEPPAAAEPSAPPQNSQEVVAAAPDDSQTTPQPPVEGGPEVAGASSGPVPVSEESFFPDEDLKKHGVPDVFESTKPKSTRKR